MKRGEAGWDCEMSGTKVTGEGWCGGSWRDVRQRTVLLENVCETRLHCRNMSGSQKSNSSFRGSGKQRAERPISRALQQCPGKGLGQILSTSVARSEEVWQLWGQKESSTAVGSDRTGSPPRLCPSRCCLSWDGLYPKSLTSASL